VWVTLRLLFLYSDPFGPRLVNNLINISTFCLVCGDTCNKCRSVYGTHAGDIYGVVELPSGLPAYIEEPEKYLPNDLPEVDIIIAVALHHDLLASISSVVESTKAKGVIVPIENPLWVPRGLQNQVMEDLESRGVKVIFPKPFCSLKPSNLKIIDQFIDEYKVGYPVLTSEQKNGVIINSAVTRSAPCGCSWYIAQRLRHTDIELLNDTVSMAHHSYPCTASMIHDRELKDTILHRAGYIARETVEKSFDVKI